LHEQAIAAHRITAVKRYGFLIFPPPIKVQVL
jgi:hypothetical protein